VKLSVYLHFIVVVRRTTNPHTTDLFLAFIYNHLYLHPIYNPTGAVRVLEEAWNLLLDNLKAVFRIAET
jgi:hypothetical protein